MSASFYTRPTIRHILAGILAAILVLLFLGYLADVVKWIGAALLFIPARLGILQQASPEDILQIDFSLSPTAVAFPAAGQYALYTSNYDLLVITDALLESGGQPWLVITSPQGERLPVAFIERGLRPYDTPLARGRPIFTFHIPAAGVYTLTHPTRPMLTVYFVRDYVSGRESLHGVLLSAEVLLIGGWVSLAVYRRFRQKERGFEALRREKRQQVEAFWQEQRRKKEGGSESEQHNRWDEL